MWLQMALSKPKYGLRFPACVSPGSSLGGQAMGFSRKALLPLSPCTVKKQKALLSRDLPLCFAPTALWQKYFSSHAGTAKFTSAPTSGQL